MTLTRCRNGTYRLAVPNLALPRYEMEAAVNRLRTEWRTILAATYLPNFYRRSSLRIHI